MYEGYLSLFECIYSGLKSYKSYFGFGVNFCQNCQYCEKSSEVIFESHWWLGISLLIQIQISVVTIGECFKLFKLSSLDQGGVIVCMNVLEEKINKESWVPYNYSLIF